MATYAIGDVQGCFRSLQALLDAIDFGAADRLWFAGDLVNRGPDSARALRWVRGLGERAVVVLGNHDLHLLACAAGVRRRRRKDTFQDVLSADDGVELLEWLRRQPLLVRDGERLLVHAGLLPVWTADHAEALARDAERVLRGRRWEAGLASWFDPRAPRTWTDELEGDERLQVAVNALTRVRVVPADGATLEREFSGSPAEAPDGLQPWFSHPARRSGDVTVVCGHWAALGLHEGPGVVALDTGCVWGGALTAYRLEDGAVTQVPAAQGDPTP